VESAAVSEENLASGPRGDHSGSFGWFASAPEGAHEVEDPVIRRVELRDDEYAAPFCDDQGHLSDNYEDLHAWLGISRGLFDDAMAWRGELGLLSTEPSDAWKRQHFVRHQELVRRLGQEIRPGIEVDSPRDEPATLVQLGRLNVDAEGVHLVLWDAVAVETGQARVLPAVPKALTRRILTWIADVGTYEEATPDNRAAILAWEDEGSAIARELQDVLGGEHLVTVL
jgi:hypothetical protein